ncbi:MAG: MaoC family dehydratase [Paracoccaceae bacterium]
MPAEGLEALLSRAGQEIGVSRWITVAQPRIDAFAAATEDRAPIHVDREAARAGPFGGTVAHGFLTLSLLSTLSYDVMPPAGGWTGVNYGLDRVRFVAAVPEGARLRGRFVLARAERPDPATLAFAWQVTLELEGAARPALVAEWLTRFLRQGGIEHGEE